MILRIAGSVQGVFFRATAKEQADALGVKGWAKNCSDGSVEIHAEGMDDAIRQFIAWCHRGPPAARVEKVLAHETDTQGCEDFTIKQ